MTRLSRMAAGMWSAAARAEVHAEHGNDAAAQRARAWVRLWSAAVLRETEPAFVRCMRCRRTYDLASWKTQPLVGDWTNDYREPGEAEAFRSRNCRCGATLSVERAQEAA